jgi:hypothetical protein
MLNRARRGESRADSDGRPPPEIYVLPKRVVKRAWQDTAFGGGIAHANVWNVDRYVNAWDLVTDFLKRPRRR